MAVGVLRSPDELDAVLVDFSAQTGLPTDRLVASRFGYPTVPRPTGGGHDGRRRVPAEVRSELGWMPHFWLDHATRTQPVDEPDDVYCIRIYLELIDRGMLNPESGRYVDPLRRWLRLDLAQQADLARMRAYQDGGWDTELCRFTIPPMSDAVPGQWRREAERIFVELDRQWNARLEEDERVSTERLEVAAARLHGVEATTLSHGVVAAAVGFRPPRGAGVLSDEVDALAGRLDLLVADIRLVAAAAETPVPLPARVDPSMPLQAELAAVKVQGPGDATSSLIRAVEWLCSELVVAAEQTVAAWDIARRRRAAPDYGYEYQGGRLRTMWDLWPGLHPWPRG